MRTVEITRSTVAAGQRVEVGSIIDLPDNDAIQLIAMGKAVPVVDAPGPIDREDEQEQKISKRAAPKKKPDAKSDSD